MGPIEGVAGQVRSARGAVSVVSTGPFPRAASRTGRAAPSSPATTWPAGAGAPGWAGSGHLRIIADLVIAAVITARRTTDRVTAPARSSRPGC